MRRILVVVTLLAAAFAVAAPARAAEVGDYFSPEQIEASNAYRGRAYALEFSRAGLALAVAIALGAGAGSRGLAAWTRRGFRRRWSRAFVLIAAATLVPFLVTLPLSLGQHKNARSFGLATNTGGEVVRDDVLSALVTAVVFGVLALLLVGIARRLPRAWPVVLAPAAGALTVLLVLVYPLAVEPLFNTFTPADQATRARVVRLADAMGVSVGDVLVSDASRRTTALNAYVSGLGSTKRVVLYDTLLAETPPSEVDVVVAHELAHQAHQDVWKGTIIGAGAAVVLVLLLWLFLSWQRLLDWIGADGPGDPAVIPFLALFIGLATLISTPAANTYSRSIEASADRLALEVTGEPQAMIDLQVRLARENLSDLDPNPVIEWAFFSHPPTLDRIEMALSFR